MDSGIASHHLCRSLRRSISLPRVSKAPRLACCFREDLAYVSLTESTWESKGSQGYLHLLQDFAEYVVQLKSCQHGLNLARTRGGSRVRVGDGRKHGIDVGTRYGAWPPMEYTHASGQRVSRITHFTSEDETNLSMAYTVHQTRLRVSLPAWSSSSPGYLRCMPFCIASLTAILRYM